MNQWPIWVTGTSPIKRNTKGNLPATLSSKAGLIRRANSTSASGGELCETDSQQSDEDSVSILDSESVSSGNRDVRVPILVPSVSQGLVSHSFRIRGYLLPVSMYSLYVTNTTA